MTSMLCHKQPGGQVRVHDTGLIEELRVDKNDNITTMMVPKERVRSGQRSGQLRPSTSPCATRGGSGVKMDSSTLIGHTMKVQDWLNEKTVKTLQEKSDLETKAARRLYSPLLETENTFVKDVDDFISTRELEDLRKKEVLHKKWNERVYKPLRKKIIEAMDSNDWPEVDRRKRELHKQYLEFTNQKGHVFLETMDPEEYYAMALNAHRPAPIKKGPPKKSKHYRNQHEDCIKAIEHLLKPIDRATRVLVRFDGSELDPKIETRPLQDPLISQARERNEEERTILRCLTGYRYSDRDIEQIKLPTMPLVPLGRHGTDSIRWLEMPLSNIESTPRMASRKRMIGLFNRTQIDFDKWTRAKSTHEEIDKELQIQKKRNYPEDQKPPFPKSPPRQRGLRPLQRIVTFLEPEYPYDVDDPMVVRTLEQNKQVRQEIQHQEQQQQQHIQQQQQSPVDVGAE